MFSIVVPIYNTEKYLEEAIQSVLNQTYTNWELILVDDGSTDNSEVICKKYVALDSRIRYFFKDNGGQASARNLGIRNAKFELIAFLDADDLWVKNKLEIQLRELDEHHPDFLYSAGVEMYPDRNVEYEWHFDKFTGDDFFKILFVTAMVNCNTVIVKKELLFEVGLFDEKPELRGVEDLDLWMRIAKRSSIVFGSKHRLAYYRIHAGGIHFQRARMYLGKLLIYEKYLRDKSVSRLYKMRQFRYVFREVMNYLNEEDRFNEIKPVMKRFYKIDYLNPSTALQRFIVSLLPVKSFIFVSNKIIYRISYRMEWLTYKLFL